MQDTSWGKVKSVRTYERQDAKKTKYYVDWRSTEGTRYREPFTSPEPRDSRAAHLRRQIVAVDLVPTLNLGQTREYWAIKQAIGTTPWVDVVSGWRQSLAALGGARVDLLVSDAIKRYLASAEQDFKDEDISGATLRQKKKKAQLFGDSFGGMFMDDVKPEQIEGWVDALGHDSDVTFDDYLKHVRTFYSYFCHEIRTNPAKEVEMRSEGADIVAVLTVQQMAQLFLFAKEQYPEALGRLALEAFAGIRFSSSTRLVKSEINFEDKGLLLPRSKVKTNRRFYIDQLPENLWPWLEATEDQCWDLKNSQWMHLKSRLFRESGVPHPKNCIRHSFCTYHVAAYKNPGLTATILCHRSQEKLWTNYNGIGTHADGKLYFSITPSTVAAIASLA